MNECFIIIYKNEDNILRFRVLAPDKISKEITELGKKKFLSDKGYQDCRQDQIIVHEYNHLNGNEIDFSNISKDFYFLSLASLKTNESYVVHEIIENIDSLQDVSDFYTNLRSRITSLKLN